MTNDDVRRLGDQAAHDWDRYKRRGDAVVLVCVLALALAVAVAAWAVLAPVSGGL